MTRVPEPLRQHIRHRAGLRCEYCDIHEDDTYFSHEIDHIIAEKHGGLTVDSNLSLACADCNRNKCSDIYSLDTETGEIVALFHPRRNSRNQQYRLNPAGVFEPLSAAGRVTLRLLKLNRLELIEERRRLIQIGRYPDYPI